MVPARSCYQRRLYRDMKHTAPEHWELILPYQVHDNYTNRATFLPRAAPIERFWIRKLETLKLQVYIHCLPLSGSGALAPLQRNGSAARRRLRHNVRDDRPSPPHALTPPRSSASTLLAAQRRDTSSRTTSGGHSRDRTPPTHLQSTPLVHQKLHYLPRPAVTSSHPHSSTSTPTPHTA